MYQLNEKLSKIGTVRCFPQSSNIIVDLFRRRLDELLNGRSDGLTRTN